MDESGIDQNAIKDLCWMPEGKTIIGKKSGAIKRRINIISALNKDNVIAPMTIYGSVDKIVFITWLKELLVPALKEGQVVVMDNASFHRGKEVREIIESAGCKLIYLPPYSPDFNPIEKYWAILKKYICKIKDKFENIMDAIDNALKNTKRSFRDYKLCNTNQD